MKKRAILSLSGGLDSTCLLIWLLANNFEVKSYSFDYGQKHSVELEKVEKNVQFLISKGLSLTHQKINLRDCFSDSISSLHGDSGIEIPNGNYGEENMKSTVVENRNVIFASIIYGKALSWARSTNSSVSIFLGIHAGDHALYPDCTPESRDACEKAFKISNWGSELVDYDAPFVNCDKSEVLAAGISCMKHLGFSQEEITQVLSNTHTCYNPDKEGRSCGECGSCKERLEAFSVLGLEDPVEYAKKI